MSEIAAALGLPVTFDFDGEEYKIAPRDFEIEGAFEVWLEEQSLKAIQRHEKSLGPVHAALQLDSWRQECAAGAYHWDGVACWQAKQSIPGRKQLAALQISKGGSMPLSDARNVVEQVFADDVARGRLEKAMEKANADPNRPRPWSGATGDR